MYNHRAEYVLPQGGGNCASSLFGVGGNDRSCLPMFFGSAERRFSVPA